MNVNDGKWLQSIFWGYYATNNEQKLRSTRIESAEIIGL